MVGCPDSAASLGGDVPGQRGSVQAVFINNTPYRAIFTYGTYDPQNPDFGPVFRQFAVRPDPTLRLEGNSTSSIETLTCGRVFSIGGQELIDRIKSKDLDLDAEPEALQAGIGFSDRPLDDPEAGQATAGRAPPVEKLLGSQFPCDSMLIFTFEPDQTQPSGVRVDLQVVPP